MSLGRCSTLEVEVSFARQVSIILYHLATLSWLLAEQLAASCWLRFILTGGVYDPKLISF